MIDFRHLFEEFLSLIDKPYDYNRLLCQLFAELGSLQQQQNIVLIDGVPYFYDPVREKYLSLARPLIQAGTHGEQISNRYLRMSDVASAGFQGFPVFRPATITGLMGRSRSTSPWTLEVRRNGVEVTIASVTVSARVGYDSNINLDIEPGDWLQLYVSGSGVEHPIAAVEIAWRASNP